MDQPEINGIEIIPEPCTSSMKRSQHIVRLALLIFFAVSLVTKALGAGTLEIKDNWYHLNGKKFFIKAIGYEIGARPGPHPYQGVRADDLDLMRFDLKVIKEGGYNALRTWSQFSEPQLKLVQESGLKLIMGIEVISCTRTPSMPKTSFPSPTTAGWRTPQPGWRFNTGNSNEENIIYEINLPFRHHTVFPQQSGLCR